MKQADLTQPTSPQSLAEALAIRLGYIYPGATEIRVVGDTIWLVLPNERVFQIEVTEV